MKRVGLLVWLFITALTVLVTAPVQAADLLWRLTHGDQYALILGTVRDASRGEMTLSVSRIVSGHKLSGQVRVTLPAGPLPIQPQNGDHLLVSVGREGRKYHVKWGFFRVNSLNPDRLRIVGPGISGSDRAGLEYYVRSGDNDFFGVFGMLFVRYPDGTFRPVYPECRDADSRHNVYICTGRNDYALIMSSTVGIELHPLDAYEESRPARYHWQASYGEFIAQDRFSGKIQRLGSEVVFSKRHDHLRLYWTLPLEKGPSRKVVARIRLTVESNGTGREWGQYMLEVECFNGWARVLR